MSAQDENDCVTPKFWDWLYMRVLTSVAIANMMTVIHSMGSRAGCRWGRFDMRTHTVKTKTTEYAPGTKARTR